MAENIEYRTPSPVLAAEEQAKNLRKLKEERDGLIGQIALEEERLEDQMEALTEEEAELFYEREADREQEKAELYAEARWAEQRAGFY